MEGEMDQKCGCDAEFWPIRKQTLLTLGIEWNAVDQAHGVLAFWALGFAWKDTWLLGAGVTWWTVLDYAAWKHFEQNNRNYEKYQMLEAGVKPLTSSPLIP